MEIIDIDDIYILTHDSHSIGFAIDELNAMRGLGTTDLRTWLRENKHPQLSSKSRPALTAVVHDIDQLPNAIEEFFHERENPDDTVAVEPAG